MMSKSIIKSSFKFVSFLGFIAASNLVLVHSAQGFSVNFTNGSFEDTPGYSGSGWEPVGDAVIQGSYNDINPTNLNSQAIITTGHSTRNDDGTNGSGDRLDFNLSGSDPVNADVNTLDTAKLQNATSLSPEAFSIPRTDASLELVNDPRTSKEGSGIYQDFTVNLTQNDIDRGSFVVRFDAAYLSNDGVSSTFGNQDFGAFSLVLNPDGSTGDINDVEVLFDSGGTRTFPTASDVYNSDNRQEYQSFTQSVDVGSLTPGSYEYRAGFEVVDVDSTDYTSALLVDNFAVEVPFEFSPTLGLLIVGGIFGGDRLRRHLKNKSSLSDLDI